MKSSAFPRRLLFAGLLFIIPTCLLKADGPRLSKTDLRDGFFLLQDVCQRESHLDLMPWFKTTPPEIAAYTKKISAAADETLATMDRLEKEDPALKPGRNPLPAIEQEVRVSIRADKQHQLLFGTTGPAFVHALLVAQIEASTYIVHLAQVMAAEDARHARSLQKISEHWLKLRAEGFRFLNAG